jgi:hypothetical protein
LWQGCGEYHENIARKATKYPRACHIEDTVDAQPAYNSVVKEGIMAGRADCCRYEPSLDELLDDEMMEPVLRSAGLDTQGFRDMIAETARRLDEPGSHGFAE